MLEAKRGDWVQVNRIVLAAGERAPQVPEDTRQIPLEMWVKGYLLNDTAQIGQEVEIETVLGRQVQGILVQIMPIFTHNFGAPQPELLTVGRELRSLIKEDAR